MPTYRCFCTTADERVITGARIAANDLPSAVEAANQLWQTEPEFRLVEVWLGADRLCPSDAGPNIVCWINQRFGWSVPASCQMRQASGQCRFGRASITDRSRPPSLSRATRRESPVRRSFGRQLAGSLGRGRSEARGDGDLVVRHFD
jgi:hypothetical protein